MDIAIVFILLIVFISIGIPIGISLGISTAIVMATMSNIKVLTIAQYCFGGLDSFPLLAVPFFVLAGNLMRYGGISQRLLDFCSSIIGAVTGGLGMVTTLACMFFAAISGSAPATVMAIGSSMIPAMGEKKYDLGYAGALTAASGSIGVIIPPSVPFVIYGVVSGASIAGLFLAGVIPGILVGLVLMIANYIMARIYGYAGEKGKFSIKKVIRSFIDAFFALLAPIIILGGIYGGIFTPTEAAVVGAFYALFVGKFIYKELDFKTIYEALKDTVQINGATTFMVGLSLAFASFLTMKQVPARAAEFFLEITTNPILILLMINGFLLIVGCFVDNISACVILTPILLPIVQNLGMDPIQFGVVMTVNLAIGFITPPYGANLFFASAVGGIPVEKVTSKILPFILAMLIVLLLITYIPALTLYLPSLMQ